MSRIDHEPIEHSWRTTKIEE